MNYFELISDRDRSLTVMFDYCSEGIWGETQAIDFLDYQNYYKKNF